MVPLDSSSLLVLNSMVPDLWPVSHSWSFTVTRRTTHRVVHAERVSCAIAKISYQPRHVYIPSVSPRLLLYGFSSN